VFLPPKDLRDRGPDSARKQFTVTLPSWMVKRLSEMAKEEGYKRNAFIKEVLRWWIDNAVPNTPTKPKK